MFHRQLKAAFHTAVENVSSRISSFVHNPGKDFSRSRKLPASVLMSYLVSQGSSSTCCEVLDFFNLSSDAPSASAVNQQKAKLRPEAMEELFHEFNRSASSIASVDKNRKFRCIAADGSTVSFFCRPAQDTEAYFVSQGHSAKGFFSIHINAFYDLDASTYSDILLQPVHHKDEFAAFCYLVDAHTPLPGILDIFIGDRGYCSYNNMAHVIAKNQYFLFRTKDIHGKGLVGSFDYPDSDSFDVTVNVVLTRSHKKSIIVPEGAYRRFIDAKTSFDFIEYGSTDTYEISFRVVRFPLSEDSFECIVTNLPRDEYPPEKIKELYNRRWGIETSFRKLKYTIGLSNFHSRKPESIKLEIWAKLIAYNATELLISHAVVEKHDTKYPYKVSFTKAAHICRIYLRLTTQIDSIDVMPLLLKELIPVRDDRQFSRLKTAHFRKPKYFCYRAA